MSRGKASVVSHCFCKLAIAASLLVLAACGDSGGLRGKQGESPSSSGSSSGSISSSTSLSSGASTFSTGVAASPTRVSIFATAPSQEGREEFQRFELHLDRLSDAPVTVRQGRVRFVTPDGEALVVNPELVTDEGGVTTATYRAEVPANASLRVLATDGWGNRSAGS